MKKASMIASAVLSAGLAFGMSGAFAEEKPYNVDGNKVDESTFVGYKIYERFMGRGCGTCHDVQSNPNLLESVKTLSKDEFITVLKNGRNAMPKASDAIMGLGLVKKSGMSEDQALDAVYNYILGRSNGDIPAGKLKKLK